MCVCDVCVGWWCECVCGGGGGGESMVVVFCLRGGRFCVFVSVWEEGRACVRARARVCVCVFLFSFSFFFFFLLLFLSIQQTTSPPSFTSQL